MGKGKIGKIPFDVAQFLNLPNPRRYTGHAFRGTSATLLVDEGAEVLALKRHGDWKSDSIAESYVRKSMHNKKKLSSMITNSICPQQTASATINAASTNQNVVLPNPALALNYVQNDSFPPITSNAKVTAATTDIHHKLAAEQVVLMPNPPLAVHYVQNESAPPIKTFATKQHAVLSIPSHNCYPVQNNPAAPTTKEILKEKHNNAMTPNLDILNNCTKLTKKQNIPATVTSSALLNENLYDQIVSENVSIVENKKSSTQRFTRFSQVEIEDLQSISQEQINEVTTTEFMPPTKKLKKNIPKAKNNVIDEMENIHPNELEEILTTDFLENKTKKTERPIYVFKNCNVTFNN